MLVIGFVSLIFDNAKLIERNDKISHWMNTAFAAFGEALIRKHVKFIQSFKKHNCLITVLLFVLAMSWIVWETFVTEFLMNFFFSRWIQACINEDLPPTTELEEGLRNGVFLAKLGHFFAQSVVPIKRIYDKDQTRYHVSFNIFLCCFCPTPTWNKLWYQWQQVITLVTIICCCFVVDLHRVWKNHNNYQFVIFGMMS